MAGSNDGMTAAAHEDGGEPAGEGFFYQKCRQNMA